MADFRLNSIILKVSENELNLCGIYKIYSILHPSKVYIGSAVKFRHRYISHRSLLNRNKHFSIKLQNYSNKHGADKLIFEIVEIIENKDNLIEREQYWIDLLKPYFNTVLQAIPSVGGHHLTTDSKRRISEAKMGNKYGLGHIKSKECRKKISEANKGRKLSIEQREFLRKINTGITQPKSQIIKRMISVLGEERIKKVKEIHHFFDTVKEKEKYYGEYSKYLSKKYGFSTATINNIKSGRMYSNFRNYEL